MTAAMARTRKDSGIVGRLQKTAEPDESAKIRAMTPRQVFDILLFADQTGKPPFVTFRKTIRKILRDVPTDMQRAGPGRTLWYRAKRLYGQVVPPMGLNGKQFLPRKVVAIPMPKASVGC